MASDDEGRGGGGASGCEDDCEVCEVVRNRVPDDLCICASVRPLGEVQQIGAHKCEYALGQHHLRAGPTEGLAKKYESANL